MTAKKDFATDERVRQMADMYRQGLTLAVIGEQYGITRERVRQLLRKAGVDAQSGGVHVVAKLKVDRQNRQRDAASLARYGITFAEIQALRANGATAAFRSHKNSARNRGIPFTLTLADWWAVWSASGKWAQRGRGKGRYCMSRINDAGGYSVGNVCVKLSTENSREATKQWVGKQKTCRGVYCLYPGSSRPYVVKVAKKQIGRYATEAEAVEARFAYLKEHGLKAQALGRGRGWTYIAKNKSKPFYMQCTGVKGQSFATAEEAEAAYAKAVEQRMNERRVHAINSLASV